MSEAQGPPATQLPAPSHASSSVQPLSSSQATPASAGVYVQVPSAGLQTPVPEKQGGADSHNTVAAPEHTPAPSHEDEAVQASESSHAVPWPSGAYSQVPESRRHVPTAAKQGPGGEVHPPAQAPESELDPAASWVLESLALGTVVISAVEAFDSVVSLSVSIASSGETHWDASEPPALGENRQRPSHASSGYAHQPTRHRPSPRLVSAHWGSLAQG